MLKLPGSLDAGGFLARHWQKKPLFIPGAFERLRPSVSRNELGWLATLDDVESRLIFTERTGSKTRYRAETGPFDENDLAELPKRDWTLLVHDVEKHLPALRKLFRLVPFIPDWRIDDLMVSFAAPGGGVGPHLDQYDVFLCQGIGRREWQVATGNVADDPKASDDLALKQPFSGQSYPSIEGDVLYLPPGVAHWGTAQRACMTYSIGMRAPQRSDLCPESADKAGEDPFYCDPDLETGESRPGYISQAARRRALTLLGNDYDEQFAATALGRSVTMTKDWLCPESATPEQAAAEIMNQTKGSGLVVHGMARIAYDDNNIYVNGSWRALEPAQAKLVGDICSNRKLSLLELDKPSTRDLICWMLESGAFELTGIF